MEYKQLLAIRNNRTNRYLSMDNQRPYSGASHPFFKHPESQNENEVFQILNAANQNHVGPIMMQSAILIYAVGQQAYLCCLQNGEMKFEKLPPNEAGLSKATKFNIYGSTQGKRPIQENEDVVFKFNDTNYMISEISMICSWNGPNITQDSTWKLQRVNSPPLPDWFLNRANENLSYLLTPEPSQQFLTKKEERKPIGNHPYLVQSIYLIEDLLFAMMGIEGTYIKKKFQSTFEYGIETQLEQSTCDLSLQQLVSKVLPMCSQHDQIEYFIVQRSKFQYGYVSQAFCSALKELMQKYMLMINQLDYEFSQGELTLQKMWYYVQPSLRIVESLSRMCHIITHQNLIGGSLLNALIDALNTTTDSSVLQTLNYLLQKSFQPYIKQLAEWVYFGKLDDPFDEFLVQEQKIKKSSIINDYKDNYWDQRFVLRTVPKFLEKYADIILRTGKYLNVINDQNPPFKGFLVEHQGHIIQSQDFSHIIQCFEWANQEIIKLLFQKEQLLKRFKSVKTFFLFDSGDFFVHFMEAAETELQKESKDISKEKLESLFDMALRSTAHNDPFKDDLICYIDQYTTQEQIYALLNLKGGDIIENKSIIRQTKTKGIDLFTLDVKVSWPANLILSRATLVNYQILFRSLFNLHYVEKQLNETWLHQKSLKYPVFLKQNGIVQRMLHLIKNYLYYLSYDVIEKNYCNFVNNLENADNFEEVKNMHTKFTEDCLIESLVIDPNFQKVFSQCILQCLQYSKQIQTQTSRLISKVFNSPEEEQLGFKKQYVHQQILQLISEPEYQKVQQEFGKQFDDKYSELLKLLKEYVSKQKGFLVNLLTKLDYKQIL